MVDLLEVHKQISETDRAMDSMQRWVNSLPQADKAALKLRFGTLSIGFLSIKQICELLEFLKRRL
jgi:hypothetical protein